MEQSVGEINPAPRSYGSLGGRRGLISGLFLNGTSRAFGRTVIAESQRIDHRDHGCQQPVHEG